MFMVSVAKIVPGAPATVPLSSAYTFKTIVPVPVSSAAVNMGISILRTSDVPGLVNFSAY